MSGDPNIDDQSGFGASAACVRFRLAMLFAWLLNSPDRRGQVTREHSEPLSHTDRPKNRALSTASSAIKILGSGSAFRQVLLSNFGSPRRPPLVSF